MLKYLRERQHFLTSGWAVVHDAFTLDEAAQLRAGCLAAVSARPAAFTPLPTIASLAKEYWHDEVAVVDAMLARRRRVLTRAVALRRKRRGLPPKFAPATGDEILAMTQILMKQLPVSPVVLDAIDLTRKNLWMTSEVIKQLLCGSGKVGSAAGRLASEVGGVEHPVLVADSPVLQEVFGAPYGYSMAGGCLPIDVTKGAGSGVSIWAFTHTSSVSSSSVHLLRPVNRVELQWQLHGLLQSRMLKIPAREWETVTTHMTSRFNLGKCGTVSETVSVKPGSMLVVDPLVFVGLGPNNGWGETVALELQAVSRDAQMSLLPLSWVQLVAAQTVVPEFSCETLFPKLGW
jgi:hypothetical protein